MGRSAAEGRAGGETPQRGSSTPHGTLQPSLQAQQASLQGRQARHRAAATVQAQVRGKAVRLERQRGDTAATAMQARARGRAVRRRRRRQQQEPPPPSQQQQQLAEVRLVGPPWRLQIRPRGDLDESPLPPPHPPPPQPPAPPQPPQQGPQLQQPQAADLPPAVLVTLPVREDGVRSAALTPCELPHASPPIPVPPHSNTPPRPSLGYSAGARKHRPSSGSCSPRDAARSGSPCSSPCYGVSGVTARGP